MEQDYVSRQEFAQAQAEISRLKNEIELLKEKKVDEWQLEKATSEINKNIALLNQKIEEMGNDRKEDREVISELKESVYKLTEQLASLNETNYEVKAFQGNIDLKINNVDLKVDSVSANVQTLADAVGMVQKTIDNGFWNTYMRLFNSYKLVKLATYILISIILFILFGAFGFYMTNGIPWGKIKTIFDIIK